jgi:hypothetical protein
MPDTLRLPDGNYMRSLDVGRIVEHLLALRSVSIVGFSNVGKSALLRLLAQPGLWTQELGEAGHEFLPIYVDCNRMLEMTDQGFYELILRCLQECSDQLADLAAMHDVYEKLIAPASDFQVPLSFNQGLTIALRTSGRKIVFLLDEFDEPFDHIDSRVFLNLRALKDRHQGQLAYVTATGRSLTSRRQENHCGEFCELFNHRTWYLAPLTRNDEQRLIRRYMEAYEVDFGPSDMDFVREWAGGHPAMSEGICRILERSSMVGKNGSDPQRSVYQDAIRRVRLDENLRLECAKIWNECSEEDQAELVGLFQTDHQADEDIVSALVRRHLLNRVEEGRLQPFCRLLAEYIRRNILLSQAESAELWVDIDSGEVLINGRPADTLTNLEYRLILLLFQNSNKIVDKYQIVSDVWGDSYIDEVDDARIEKLVSRLRQKIEMEVGLPRFLTTVRGRGYRLNID